MPVIAAGPLFGHAITTAELMKEALHRRAGLFVIALFACVGRPLLHGDLDRDHRRLHALHHVGKANRLRSAGDGVIDLSLCRAGENIEGGGSAKAVNGNAEPGNDGGHQRQLSHGQQ
jgi:hypothetical protein